MMDREIHVLFIEDHPADARLVHEKLSDAWRVGWDLPHFRIEHVDHLQAALDRLDEEEFDVVLSDLDLPDSQAGETVASLRAHIPEMPLVVLTGREDEALARTSVRAGVQDYLYKSEVTGSLLARTLMYAIERQQVHAELERRVAERTSDLRAEVAERRRAEEQITSLSECFSSLGANPRENISRLVETAGEVLGGACLLYNRLEKERRLLSTWSIWQEPEGYDGEDAPEGHICYDVILEGGKRPVVIEDLRGTKYEETDPNVRKYGLRSYLGYPVRLEGETVGSFCLCDVERRHFTDRELRIMGMMAEAVTREEERKRAAETLQESEQRYRRLVDLSPDLIAVHQESKLLYINPAGLELLGVSDSAEVLGRPVTDFVTPPKRGLSRERIRQMLEKGETSPLYEQRLVRPDGTERAIEVVGIPFTHQGQTAVQIIAHDITERKRTEARLKEAFSAARERERETRHLLEASQAVLECHTFKEAARRIFDAARQATGATAGYIALLSDDGMENEVVFLEAGGLPCSVDPELPMPIRGLRAEAYAEAKVVYENDFEKSEWVRFMPAGHVAMDNVMFAPLTVDDRVLGIIGLANKSTDFTDEDAALAQAFGDMAAMALRRVHMEEALRESEERFRSFFENAQIGVALVDQSTKFQAANPFMCSWLGYTEQELQGLTVDEVTHPEDWKRERALIQEMREGKRDFVRVEKRYVTKEGEIVWGDLATNIIHDAQGSYLFGLGTVVDVSERKRAEQALRESEVRFRSFVEQSSDGFVLTDTEGRVLEWNRAQEEITQISRSEALGTPIWELLCRIAPVEKRSPEVAEALRSSVLASLRTGQGPGLNTWLERRAQRPDGTECILRTVTFPIAVDDGSFAIGSTTRDVTARRRVEEQLGYYAAQLKRSNQELEQFAYVISHDLREPLRTVKGFLELLERRYAGDLDQQAGEFIDYAVEGAERMQEMIGALLDLARVGTQGRPFASTDVDALLERTLHLLKQAVDDAGAEVTHDPLPVVMADEAQLAQVFQNLIANALKFRQGDEVPRVHIAAERVDDMWRFSVADNGIGVDSRQADRIFQIFQRLHPREAYPGTGIGLALCKRIVERHGGRIWVESEPGQGSTFYFTWPGEG
jgi:PAS domain S-box-containing protein